MRTWSLLAMLSLGACAPRVAHVQVEAPAGDVGAAPLVASTTVDAGTTTLVPAPPGAGAPRPLPAPHPGSAFVVHGAIERPRSFGMQQDGVETQACGLDTLGLLVLRSSDEVRAREYLVAAPVDFSRWILIVPRDAAGRLQLREPPSRWLEPDDRVLEVRLEDPCAGICGGASSVQLRRMECQLAHAADAFLVPRPVAELRVVRVERWCNPALP